MSDKKKIALIGIGCFAMLIVLVVLLVNSLQQSVGVGSLRNDEPEPTVEIITDDDLQQEYENREELPESIKENMFETIQKYLSLGQFVELDSLLREWGETYKATSSEDEDESVVIDSYRADIAYYQGLLTDGPKENWYFTNPDALAAAISYAPISIKYKAFLRQDSILFPSATNNILIQESDKTPEELKAQLEYINSQQSAQKKYLTIKMYSLYIAGYACTLTEVMDSQYLYQPYSLSIDSDEVYDITCKMVADVVSRNPYAVIDDMFVMPTVTDPDAIPNSNTATSRRIEDILESDIISDRDNLPEFDQEENPARELSLEQNPEDGQESDTEKPIPAVDTPHT